MTDHFFRESEPGYVKHTVATKALVQIPLLVSWSLMGMSEVGPAKMHVGIQTMIAAHYLALILLADSRCR